ncbi:hypothetical protein [Paenibacillus roseipurpureus]|uniref:Uncharacterized protein n=1 Tax=Paenibacillus roseopurpureus TaxID=2918901 RepID=A0AA96LPJ3_9BACL|nr:hypothetical protein [Paenibacillus sp. MBLB1832]WNR44952.1 hypothetical protein MJB10_02020 [Paenibacillus sp. MBLB1832]
MNTPNPDDLRKELEEGPLQQQGFTPKLRHDIEEAIRQKERTRSKVKPLLIFAGFGATLALIWFFPWHTLHTQSEAAALESAQLAAEAAAVPPPAPINTALLIGLRTEHEPASGGANQKLAPLRYSTYRTMLIAPVRGQLQKTSEGTGILMPYKQNFWKIDSLTRTSSKGESHYLSVHLADQSMKSERFLEPADQAFNRVETLLFAGNQYLSIAESEEAWNGNAPYQANRIWTRTLPQLKEARTMAFYKKPLDKNHVSLMDVYGVSLSAELTPLAGRIGDPMNGEISGQSWTVQRAPGKWVGKVAETAKQGAARPDYYTLHDFPRELPDKVVNHDDLIYSWTDIKASWPHATDALTSPLNDMLVIFEAGQLKFYSYGQAPGSVPQLVLDLQPGEQLVMAQWATDHYVQEWIDKVDRYLPTKLGPFIASDGADARTAGLEAGQ